MYIYVYVTEDEGVSKLVNWLSTKTAKTGKFAALKKLYSTADFILLNS